MTALQATTPNRKFSKLNLQPSLGGLYSPRLFGELQPSVQGAGTPRNESHTRVTDGQGQGMQLMNEPQTEQRLFQTPKWPLRGQGHFSSPVPSSFLTQLVCVTNIALFKGALSQKLVTNLTQGLNALYRLCLRLMCWHDSLIYAELNDVSTTP